MLSDDICKGLDQKPAEPPATSAYTIVLNFMDWLFLAALGVHSQFLRPTCLAWFTFALSLGGGLQVWDRGCLSLCICPLSLALEIEFGDRLQVRLCVGGGCQS